MNTKKQLRYIERDLNGIIAAITQVSNRRTRRARGAAKIVAGKVAGAAGIGGMLMFISAFGSASTGTAIGALGGAAATSAQMYWIGSIFGLGAVAGSIILPIFGAVLGLAAVVLLSWVVFGRPRKPKEMQDFEVQALFAAHRLAAPLTEYLNVDAPSPTGDELRIYSHEGLLPLCALIGEHLNSPEGQNKKDKSCPSFRKTLALLPRWKLSRHHRKLMRRAERLARPEKKAQIPGLLRWSSRSHSNA